jgi:pyruvate/2-oxoglutarate/acetoin dehydrogenase E1 component
MSDQLEFRVAIREAIIEEMERDESVVFFGEDIAAEQGGVFAVTPGIQERFGAERVFDTPISELAITGAAFGAAVTGLRPINQSAKYWYLSNEQRSAPLVVRSAVGGGGRFGAIHSQTHASWFQGIPGLKIAFPSSPAEAKGLLKAAVRDENPVIFLEHKRLYSVKGPGLAPDQEVLPLGRARIARRGTDVTITSAGKGVPDALEAAEQLARDDGIEAEVIDLRTLRPLDLETVLESVARTNRLLAVEEGPATGGWASGLLGRVAEHGLHDLDDAWLLTTGELPIPYSPTLEDAFIPDADAIVATVRERAGIHA